MRKKSFAFLIVFAFSLIFRKPAFCTTPLPDFSPCCLISAIGIGGLGGFVNYPIDSGANHNDVSGGIRWSLPLDNFRPEISYASHKFPNRDNDNVTINSVKLSSVHILDLGFQTFYPFASVGMGYYDSAHFADGPGAHAGVGLIKKITASSDFAFDISLNYDRILTPGSDTDFFGLRVGLGFFWLK